jgi:agmatinase
VKTTALFFPFDLFGSAGAGTGTDLLADALEEMLADNQREREPTRAQAYQGQVRLRRVRLDKLTDYQTWRERARQAARRLLRSGDFFFWVSGNHLGVLPLYDELAGSHPDTVVIQLDAHLDVYNLSDCTSDLSHGNFLLHCAGSLPPVINVGHRELLLRPDYVRQYYRHTLSAAEVALHFDSALETIHKASRSATRVLVDLDCDVFDPAYFPGVAHPLPFGLSPQQVLRVLEAAWSDRLAGIAISEFDPGRDQNDRSLSLLVWLLEYLLLKRYEENPGLHDSQHENAV